MSGAGAGTEGGAPVTATIIEQVGRQAFLMAFTRALTSEALGSVTFMIAPALVRSTRGKATHVRVTLDHGSDTYVVECLRVKWGAADVVESMADVYADDLRSVIERMTGLYLKL